MVVVITCENFRTILTDLEGDRVGKDLGCTEWIRTVEGKTNIFDFKKLWGNIF
jgi:hypothetical protein